MIVLFNKPFRVLSQFTSEGDKATLADYIELDNVYAAGRLDYDSAHIGYPTLRLIRHRIGDWTLGDIEVGRYVIKDRITHHKGHKGHEGFQG